LVPVAAEGAADKRRASGRGRQGRRRKCVAEAGKRHGDSSGKGSGRGGAIGQGNGAGVLGGDGTGVAVDRGRRRSRRQPADRVVVPGVGGGVAGFAAGGKEGERAETGGGTGHTQEPGKWLAATADVESGMTGEFPAGWGRGAGGAYAVEEGRGAFDDRAVCATRKARKIRIRHGPGGISVEPFDAAGRAQVTLQQHWRVGAQAPNEKQDKTDDS